MYIPDKTKNLFYINSNKAITEGKHKQKSGNFENIGFQEHTNIENSNQIKPIIPSKHPLCDKIDDAIKIKNNAELNFKLYNLKELQFMLICVERRENEILRIISFYKDIYFLAFALVAIPVVALLSSFLNYLIKIMLPNLDFKMNTLSTNFVEWLSNVLNQIMSINPELGILLSFFIMFTVYFLFQLFISVFASNSKIIFWIKNNKKFNRIIKNFSKFINRYRQYLIEYLKKEYEKNPFNLIWGICWLLAFLGTVIMKYFSIQIEYIFSSNFLLLFLSGFLMFISVSLTNRIKKILINCDKIILELNYEILFKNN